MGPSAPLLTWRQYIPRPRAHIRQESTRKDCNSIFINNWPDMIEVEFLLCILLVSVLWGITNPLLKRASVGIEDIQMSNPVLQTLCEVKFLASRLNYVCPFLLNQLGSILFVYSLGTTDLSLAVPLSNSLTFLVTTLVGRCLGEETTSKMTWVGASLVCAGVALCVADKTRE